MTSTIQNRMGAQFEQETLTWVGEKFVLTVTKYGSTVTEGGFSLIPLAEFQKAQEKQREANKTALK